ncbi:MAG: hypothetical protein IPP88_16490 [Betaproteobacteria bacterium]|nr:hypothetical protein [Betaproteobacteria bacterium]
MSATLKQPVIVENRPGASGQIAASAVAKAAPDGYTLMLDASSYTVNPSLFAKLPYDTGQGIYTHRRRRRFGMLVSTAGYPGEVGADVTVLAKKQPGAIVTRVVRQRFRAASGRCVVRTGRRSGYVACCTKVADLC